MKKLSALVLLLVCFTSYGQQRLIIQGSPPDIFINHTIATNESFLKLASLYNLSPLKIASYNSLSLSSNLTEGATVKVPLTNLNFEQRGQSGTYEVLVPLYHSSQGNETLDVISKRYNNVSTDLLKDWNLLEANSIPAGRTVVVGHLRVKSALANYFGAVAKSEQQAITKTEEPALKKVEEPVAKKEEPTVKNIETIEPKKNDIPVKKEEEQLPNKTTELAINKAIEKAAKNAETATKPIEELADKTGEAVTIKLEDASNYSSDRLFTEARKAAFGSKNYPLAIEFLKAGLAKSPDYSDLRVFLGRIYTWTDKVDSAREQFEQVIKTDSTTSDVYVAYADLEYWNDKPEVALEIVEKGLVNNAQSKELLFRKAKLLNNLKKPDEALKAVDRLLKIDPKNTEARALAAKIRGSASLREIGVSYDYSYFDKQFGDPWHLVSVDYTTPTKLGSVAFRVNYANRFKSSGVQYEIESYPHIAPGVYSYVSVAYSDNVGVFPKYRGGFSLYASLPKSFEGEVGFRYLKFSDATWIYTAALGKYYSSWLFTARAYLTPAESAISHSYNLTARYYYGGADDFFGLTLGTGISPDETQASILLNTPYRLLSQKASATYKHSIKDKHVITLDAGWINTEFRPKTKGNQITAGIAYIIRV